MSFYFSPAQPHGEEMDCIILYHNGYEFDETNIADQRDLEAQEISNGLAGNSAELFNMLFSGFGPLNIMPGNNQNLGNVNFDANGVQAFQFGPANIESIHFFTTMMNLLYQVYANPQEDVKIVLKKEAYDALKNKPFNEYTNLDGECTICKVEFSEEDTSIIETPCNHHFHSDCINHWLLNLSHTCPVCRTSCGDHHPLN